MKTCGFNCQSCVTDNNNILVIVWLNFEKPCLPAKPFLFILTTQYLKHNFYDIAVNIYFSIEN